MGYYWETPGPEEIFLRDGSVQVQLTDLRSMFVFIE